MECRAEINRFAIFLFCLLVPLGSMAPTQTSESKVTAEQRLKHFTTEILTYASVIQQQANKLSEFYQNCTSAMFNHERWNLPSKAKDMADRIPKCTAFHANCCALHHIHNTLKTLQSGMETICPDNNGVVKTNINQLDAILSQGTVFYNCSSQEQSQEQTMGQADRMIYIWHVLKRYKEMQLTGNPSSRAAV